jgi:hypothetical protein
MEIEFLEDINFIKFNQSLIDVKPDKRGERRVKETLLGIVHDVIDNNNEYVIKNKNEYASPKDIVGNVMDECRDGAYTKEEAEFGNSNVYFKEKHIKSFMKKLKKSLWHI